MSEASKMSPYLQFALELAGTAAQEIVPRFQRTDVRSKADGSPVTEADTEAERVMRELIQARYPDHGIMGEEQDDINPEAELCWVLDPIDGTSSFALGLPTFGTLIALLRNAHPVLGVINMPGLKETVYAELGSGCWYLNRLGELEQVRVSQGVERVEEAYLSTTGLYNTDVDPRGDDTVPSMSSLIRRAKKFRFVGDCLQHAWVARGLLDGAVDPKMNPWDNAALIPCILEAGGVLSDISGSTEDMVHAPNLVTAANPDLLSDMLNTLKGH
ncbi:MAG: inositol monophosphatase family protein [Rhodothermales bacterium]